jgi:hypothetical protein
MRRAPGHISWNVWISGAWRQNGDHPGRRARAFRSAAREWDGGTHPGRIRLQTFRPGQGEPLTDALIGQGMMSLGGGGYGGVDCRLPVKCSSFGVGEFGKRPCHSRGAARPRRRWLGRARYALIAVGPQGLRSAASPATRPRACEAPLGQRCGCRCLRGDRAMEKRSPARCASKDRTRSGRTKRELRTGKRSPVRQSVSARFQCFRAWSGGGAGRRRRRCRDLSRAGGSR